MKKNEIFAGEREHLTKEEVTKLLNAVKKTSRNPERDFCLLLMIIRHGLKVSEVISVRLREVELENNKLCIPWLNGYASSEYPFYGESAALKDWLDKRAEMKAPRTVDTLFVSEQRRPMSRGTVNLLIKIAGEAAGLDYLSIHPEMLRRTCGYGLASKGIDLRTVQSYLRHHFNILNGSLRWNLLI